MKFEADASWEKWQDADGFGGNYAVPYWIESDRRLFAHSRVGDTAALYVMDPKTRQLEPEPVVSLKGYDFAGSMVYDAQARRLVGVHYETDGRGPCGWIR